MSKNKNYIMIMMVALVAILLTIMPVSATVVGKHIGQGATIFVGEEGLDISSAMGGYTTIGYWGSGANLLTTSPLVTIPVNGRLTSFSVTQVEFANYIGNWYRLNPDGSYNSPAFTVYDPAISLSVMSVDNSGVLNNVNGKSVVAGTNLTFNIETNIRLDTKRGDELTTLITPIANFTAVINPLTGKVQFTPDITIGTAPFNYLWEFGDGTTSTSVNPLHTYVSTGVHNVRLTVSNTNVTGTSSKVNATVNIASIVYDVSSEFRTASIPTPPGAPSASFTVDVDSSTGNVEFSDNSANIPNVWVWNFGDGTTSTEQDPTHTYSPVIGSHVVTLEVYDTVVNPISGHSKINATINVTSSYTGSVTGNLNRIIPSIPEMTLYRTNPSNGYMDIVVKSESGSTYDQLKTSDTTVTSLKNQFINTTPFYWNGGSIIGSKWDTDALSNGQKTYQNGVYQVWVECNLNDIKDNYKNNGAYYLGKTVSTVSSITIGSDTLKLEVDRSSVVRGKPFAITLSGQVSTSYNIWLKGVSSSNTAPMIVKYQEGVFEADNNTFATIITDTSGKRTIAFTTSVNTKEQKYIIRAESMDKKKYDEITINVVKGGLTLVASGDQNYYLGEEIKLSGTNSETEYVYFFIVGPNLDSDGADLNEPGKSVDHGVFAEADVSSEDTFTYDWATSGVDLDSGTYTIYGVSQPVDRNELQNVSYATVSVIIKKPYVSARASQSTIAKGDKLFIEGDAQGNPSSGVAVWVLGKNYAKRFTQQVESDSTYKYEIPGAETSSMASGQYFIIVQHPMQNDRFDIDIIGDYVDNKELGDGSGTTIFRLYGSGSLQGSDAAEALIQAISDPNVDDTYTKLTIIVSEPLITINPITDKHVGDKFNITGKTNLAVDDEILMEVYSSSFKPTQKVQSGEFSGATGSIKVVKGEAGMNTFSFEIDASTFKVDEYIVVAQSIVQGATGTALFNVVEGASTNPVVTPVAPVVTAPVVVTAPPTVPPTAPPTQIPTTIVPTTTKSPGFGAVFALIGLGVVAFMVVRRE